MKHCNEQCGGKYVAIKVKVTGITATMMYLRRYKIYIFPSFCVCIDQIGLVKPKRHSHSMLSHNFANLKLNYKRTMYVCGS